jgi:hypothetical protein
MLVAWCIVGCGTKSGGCSLAFANHYSQSVEQSPYCSHPGSELSGDGVWGVAGAQLRCMWKRGGRVPQLELYSTGAFALGCAGSVWSQARKPMVGYALTYCWLPLGVLCVFLWLEVVCERDG